MAKVISILLTILLSNDNIIRPLCIILPQISGYIKHFMMVEKICPLKLKMITYW